MLSKVLTEAEAVAEAKPVVWRRTGLAIPTKAAHPTPEPHNEVTQLRARMAELSAAAEQQARQAYEAGVRAAEASARKSIEPLVEQLTNTIAEVSAMRSAIIRNAESDTVRLAIEIARRVLHREVTVDSNALEALTKAALDKLQAQEIHRVRVHPDLEKLVRESLQKSGRGQVLSVVPDPSQPPGGILFDISRGTLDASVSAQLAEIERGLADQLDSRL